VWCFCRGGQTVTMPTPRGHRFGPNPCRAAVQLGESTSDATLAAVSPTSPAYVERASQALLGGRLLSGRLLSGRLLSGRLLGGRLLGGRLLGGRLLGGRLRRWDLLGRRLCGRLCLR